MLPNTQERVKHALEKGDRSGGLDPITHIAVDGACQNNLKHLSLKIPRGEITICTGPLQLRKKLSCLRIQFLLEGQRHYADSLSAYARQFVKQMPKPKVSFVEGLSPAIAIEQKTHAGNPRSTVGTLTEIYNYTGAHCLHEWGFLTAPTH